MSGRKKTTHSAKDWRQGRYPGGRGRASAISIATPVRQQLRRRYMSLLSSDIGRGRIGIGGRRSELTGSCWRKTTNVRKRAREESWRTSLHRLAITCLIWVADR